MGLHYYTFAWHPAMLELAPQLTWRSYAFYVYIYFIICVVPNRIGERVKANIE